MSTLHNSYASAASIIARGTPGAFVECGVYAGSQCGAMALAAQDANAIRQVHCFDSFCGFPKASLHDSQEWQDRLDVGSSVEPSRPLDPAWGFNVNITSEVVRDNFRQWGFPSDWFTFHVGWFQETVPSWREPIAVLRLDGDLYESTMVCLNHLYPLLSPGGICIIDDYDVAGCRKACDEFFNGSVEPIEVGGGPVWWCAK